MNKYEITLKNIEVHEILHRFNMEDNNSRPENTTQLDELLEDQPYTISFLDESKQNKTCMVLMVNRDRDICENKSDCHWCHHSFESLPIGCPIDYISDTIVKSYYSEISKDNYVIKEKVTSERSKIVEKYIKIDNYNITKKGYYVVDGCFCSFNCCKSYINEHSAETMYENSYMYLLKMYNSIFKTNIDEIKNAPDWRLLKKYGGVLEIESFRNDFNRVEYNYHGILKNIYKPVGRLFEEKLKI